MKKKMRVPSPLGYTHRLTLYRLKGDSLEFIVFIPLKWSSFAVSSSSHNITLQINHGALI